MVRAFLDDESGAATVDGVALCGSVILLGIVIVFAIYSVGGGGAVQSVNTSLKSVDDSSDLASKAGFN